MKRESVMEEDKILTELQFIKHRINASSQILTDKERTAFFFVVVPEEMIIIDTKNASELFAEYVPISGICQPNGAGGSPPTEHPRLLGETGSPCSRSTWARSSRCSATA